MKLKKTAAFLLALTAAATTMTMPVGAAQVFGDIDGDNDVDAADAAWILQYAAYTGAGGEQDLQSFVKGEPEVPDDSDSPLTILVWDENRAKVLGELYTAAYPDANIEIVTGPDAGNNAEKNFAAMIRSDSEIDLYLTEIAWQHKYINDETLSIPLSSIGISTEEFSDAYSYTVDMGMNDKKELAAAALEVSPAGYCYREDLAKEYLGIDSPEEMQQALSLWDDFLLLGQRLYEASDGTVTAAASIGDAWQPFNQYVTNMPRIVDGTINKDRALHMITVFQQYIESGILDPTINQWDPTWAEEGKNDSTLGYFYASWCLGDDLILEQNGGDGGNWRIVQGPNPYYWGGTSLCVSPNCDNKDEAARFIRYFTAEDEGLKAFAEEYGTFVNSSSVMQTIASEHPDGNPLLGGQNDIAVLNEIAANITVNPDEITKYDSDLSYALYDVFRTNYGKSADKILALFENEVYMEYPELEAAE